MFLVLKTLRRHVCCSDDRDITRVFESCHLACFVFSLLNFDLVFNQYQDTINYQHNDNKLSKSPYLKSFKIICILPSTTLQVSFKYAIKKPLALFKYCIFWEAKCSNFFILIIYRTICQILSCSIKIHLKDN